MTRVSAVVRDGRLDLSALIDLPNGSAVEVTVRPVAPAIDIHLDTPDSIAAWIDLAESCEPPVLTDEEWAADLRRRRDDRAWELAAAEARHARLAPPGR